MNIHTAIHVLLAQVLLSFANAVFAFRKRESISLSHHRPMYIYGGVANNKYKYSIQYCPCVSHAHHF